MAAVVSACRVLEGDAVAARRAELGLPDGAPWTAAIMPHDDYLYSGRTDLHLLPGLRARRWIVLGVCHACRRLGVRDRLIFEDFDAWRMAGRELPVDAVLRSRLLAELGEDFAVVDDARHAAEHSVESLLPWLREANPEAGFVPLLVPGMDWPRLLEAADALAGALARICADEGWTPGVDLGLLISADAVHYGCEGWGSGGGYHPFGCDAAGRAAGVAQDLTLARATLAGPLDDAGLADFARMGWKPGDPEDPYRILAAAARLQAALGLPPLVGHLLRYGDSVGDGRLDVPGTGLGVTAPNTLEHWVGYPALGYLPAVE